MHIKRKRCSRQGLPALLTALLGLQVFAPCIANPVDFPVTGSITVNGNARALPSGGVFGPSSYDNGTGVIATGAFTFPQSTTSFNSVAGTVVVTYLLSQTNTSSGQVATDGIAALSATTLKLQVIAATVGVIPIDVGTCVFAPIDLVLDGTGSAAGLDLADSSFVIPQVGPTDCGTYGSEINNAIAGSNNSMQIHLAGDFAPPVNDTIFVNGFDP